MSNDDQYYVQPYCEGKWFVYNSRHSYIVSVEACSCPHFQHRLLGTDEKCKHQLMLLQYLQQLAEKK